MLIALLPSRKYQPHRNQLDGLGTKTLLMKKTRQALLCRLLLALQAAAHRRLARLQPWPRWLPILIRSFAIYGYESHYQKIDKYKQKYRGNIFVGKFPRDFTDGNIPSVYTEGITVGKKIKTKQKKNDDVSFLPTELPTESPTEQIPSVNLLVNCEHCSSC
jgi:hypothetical protein